MPRNDLNQGTADALIQGWFPVGPAANPRFVVVVDIGQGNCNVVFNDAGLPFLYYDMGGGMGWSQFTYPIPRPVFCLDVNVSRFIVSHWDEDHYRTMSELIGAGQLGGLECLGPTQEFDAANYWSNAIKNSLSGNGMKTFIHGPAGANGTLNCWPDEDYNQAPVMMRVDHAPFRVIKVSGKDHNNHGLALRLENANVPNEFILLTGDSTFEQLLAPNQNTIRHGCDQQCVGLVAGHHGAKVGHAPYVPRPAPGNGHLLAYSFGWGNNYGHPELNLGVASYEGRGWDDDHRMDTGGAEITARYAGPRGNVGLRWPADPAGPGRAAGGAAAQVNAAAIALLATAAAEADVWQNLLANKEDVAIGAAYQAARETNQAAVAAAMLAPAVTNPPWTLAQVAAAGGAVVHASLTAALGHVVATSTIVSNPHVQALAKAIVDCVAFAGARMGQLMTAWGEKHARSMAAANAGAVNLPSQARLIAREAYGCAVHPTTIGMIEDEIPAALLTVIHNTANAVSNVNVPAVGALRTAVVAAVSAAAAAVLGQPGVRNPPLPMVPSAAPPHAATLSTAAVVALRDDVTAAIGAAAALIPAAAVNPQAVPPPTLTDNENAKLVMRVGAIAAIAGTPSAHLDQVAGAAAGAARVAFAAAGGAPQTGCHRHPRTCANGPCALSIHYFQAMFPGSIETFAGTGANADTGDGAAATAATFGSPAHVAYDRDWNVYISDPAHHRIRKVDPSGDISAFAGTGNGAYAGDAAGAPLNASFENPAALAVDAQRRILYVADRAAHQVRQIDLATGVIALVAGTGLQAFGGDRGPATGAQLDTPSGLAFHANSGTLYIADTGNNRIRKVNLRTGVITTAVGTGAGNGGDGGQAVAATLQGPTGIFVDEAGTLYIADTGNHRVRWVNGGVISALAGTGVQNFWGDGGLATAAQLDSPTAVAVDWNNIIYIADAGNHRIRAIDLIGNITTVVGTGLAADTGDGGAANAATVRRPVALACNANNDLFIVDDLANRVRLVSGGNIDAFAGDGTNGFGGDPFDAPNAQLSAPLGIAVASLESVIIADSGNRRIREVDGAMDIDTVAGDGQNQTAGDANAPAIAADLQTPGGMAVDPGAGALYFADSGNHRIRRVDLKTGTISLLAGDGTQAFGGDGGAALAARFDNPTDVAFDPVDKALFVCDRGNARIRKITLADGQIDTICGNGNAAFSGDTAAAVGAELHDPTAICVDKDGNIFIATVGDHRVRKITFTTGNIDTICGDGNAGHTGDGAAANLARLHTPMGLAVDNAGQLYISVAGSHKVRKIDTVGFISTLVGTGANAFGGDGGAPAAAQIDTPRGIAVDDAGRNLFIADVGNRRVRRARL